MVLGDFTHMSAGLPAIEWDYRRDWAMWSLFLQQADLASFTWCVKFLRVTSGQVPMCKQALFQFLLVLLVTVPLFKASHMAKFRAQVGRGHEYRGAKNKLGSFLQTIH